MGDLARLGKTVICTIHQPSSEVFEMFDRILLMAEGRTAFLGPIKEAPPFFSAQGYLCPANYNPSDFYIFTLAVIPGQQDKCREKVNQICGAYDSSEFRKRVDHIIKHQHYASNRSESLLIRKKNTPYKAGWFTQFGAVFWRSWLTVLRDPQITLVKGCSSIVCNFKS